MAAQALQDMTERHAGVIAELTGILMNAARQSEADIACADSPEAKKDAYDRLPGLARAVRLCLAMEGRIQREGLKDAQAAETAARAAEQAAAQAGETARREERERRKALLADRVVRTLEETFPDDDENDNAAFYERQEDLRTRLSDEVFDEEFAELSYEEALTRVYRDLGLPAPVLDPQDRIRAIQWTAQWAAWSQASAAGPKAAPPDPPPAYSSG